MELRRGPLDDLTLEIVVQAAGTGHRAIAELRARGGHDLVPVALDEVSRTGATVHLRGVLSAADLERLATGTHDVSVLLLAGLRRTRHDIRVQADRSAVRASLPLVEPYVTQRGNLSLRRRPGRLTHPPVTGPAAAQVDPRSVDPSLASLAPALAAQLRATLGAADVGYHLPTRDAVCFEHLVPGLDVSLEVARAEAGWEITARPRGRTSARFLRNTLVGEARMVRRHGVELHHVARLPEGPSDAARAAQGLTALIDRFRLFLDAGPRPEESGLVPTQWWDAKPNFGDVLGPLIVQSLTGRPAINVRSFPSEDPGLFTVGSIAAHLERPGARIWGSGLIGGLSPTKVAHLAERAPREVHAVRGRLTREALGRDLGWSVPEVYGDPALLLPRWYTPRPSSHTRDRIALVPHYMHLDLLPPQLPDDVVVVDVRQGPEEVVDQIASARACISSSLHGLVVAQAYEVPWTWLRIGEKKLHGDTFKFEDFFTTLDREAVQLLDLEAPALQDQPWGALAAHARVPAPRFDADRLVSAFPAV